MVNEDKKYFDQYDLLHLTDEPGFEDPEQTENAPMFTAEYMTAKVVAGEEIDISPRYDLLRLSEDKFRTTPVTQDEEDTRFSHDSMTGLYCYRIINDLPVDDLPVFKWNGRIWMHPRDWIFYGLCRGSLMALLASPLLLPMVVHTFFKNKNDTSGKRLWFLRIKTLLLKKNNLLIKLLDKTIESMIYLKHDEERIYNDGKARRGFPDVFAYYFSARNSRNNLDHPIVQLIDLIYEK